MQKYMNSRSTDPRRKGVCKDSSITSVLESQSFERARPEELVGTPSKMVPDTDSALVKVLPAAVDVPVSTDELFATQTATLPEPIPRQVYIGKREFQKYGYTRDCPSMRCNKAR